MIPLHSMALLRDPSGADCSLETDGLSYFDIKLCLIVNCIL